MNNISKIPVALVLGALILFGSGAVPNAAANGIIDRLFNAIAEGKLPPGDIKTLEHAAEGRLEDADVALVLSLGIARGDFSPSAMRADGVRAHALRKLGESGLPEALRYLSAISPAESGTDYSHQVWSAARIALQVALLNNISTQQAKIAFLRKAMTLQNQGHPDGEVQVWAINELCDRGDLESLPAIKEWFMSAYSGATAERQAVQYCEERMRVVSSDPNRVNALASILRLGAQPPDAILTSWAILQLAALHSPEADREIARFGAEIALLPRDSPARQQLGVIEDGIRRIIASQSAVH
jgi:hypothetical protein